MQLEPHSESVTIAFPDHKSAFVDGMWRLYQEKQGVDLEITCSNLSLKVHHAIMSLFVPSFRDSLGSPAGDQQVPPKTPSLDLGCFVNHVDDLELLVEFVYRGSVTVPVGQLESLFLTADRIGVGALSAAIDDQVRKVSGSRNLEDRSCQPEILSVLSSTSDLENVINGRRKKTMTPREMEDSPNYAIKVIEGHDRLILVESERTDVAVDGRQKRKSMFPDKDVDATEEEILLTDHTYSTDIKAGDGLPMTGSAPEIETPSGGAESSEEPPRFTWRPRLPKRTNAAKSVKPRKEKVVAIKSSKQATRKQQMKVVKVNNELIPTNEYKKLWRQNQPLLKCTQCSYETRDKVTFKSHVAKHDPTAVEFKCKFCGKCFRSKKGFTMHEQSHSGKSDCFPCPYCESTFTQRGSLSRHVTGMHKMDGKGKPLDKNHKCGECSFTCQYRSLLKLHVMRKHSSERPYQCLQCSHRCVLKSDLDKHVSIVHLRRRNHMCDFCGYCSTHKGALNRHMRSHSKEKPYLCGTCGKCYADSHKLKNHLHRHLTDEKPFVCHLCGHCCRRKDNLQMHMKRRHKFTITV